MSVSIEQYAAMRKISLQQAWDEVYGTPKKKKSKYNNNKCVVDGINFDSEAEAKRYSVLKLLERSGAISNLELQPEFILQEGFRDRTGKKHIAIKYKADFKYMKNGTTIIEDKKGFKTKVYNMKKKMLLFKHPDITFIET